MRKLMVLEHISLDGVIQAPGGPDEDPSGGFPYGGWIAAYSDAVLGAALRKQMAMPFDLLLGRTTYEIWAPYWPQHPAVWPSANTATKYVASNTLTAGAWSPTVILSGDVAGQVAALKRQPGPDLHVWGSGQLIQTLMAHDLVDAFWLMLYPLTLGVGKRLFAQGTPPAAFAVTDSQLTPSGILVATYARAGALPPSRSSTN